MTSMSDLWQDLVEEILSKVPITSLGAVRATCKGWNTLSKDRILCTGEPKQQFLGFMMYDHRLCSMRFNLHGIHNEDGGDLVGISMCQVEISNVFYCAGLLLCVSVTRDKSSKLVIWNPYLGQTKWIELKTETESTYALGYDKNKNRKLLDLPFQPPDDYDDFGDSGDLSCVKEEKLAALYHHCDALSIIEIWVTTKIEPNAVSWIPFLKVDIESLHGLGFTFYGTHNSFFIDEEKKLAVVFSSVRDDVPKRYQYANIIGQDSHFKKVDLGEVKAYRSPLVCSSSYVPSLVQINQTAGPKSRENKKKRKRN